VLTGQSRGVSDVFVLMVAKSLIDTAAAMRAPGALAGLAALLWLRLSIANAKKTARGERMMRLAVAVLIILPDLFGVSVRGDLVEYH